MSNADSQFMRQMLTRLEHTEAATDVVEEGSPMGLLRALQLQITRPFVQGADTQIWSGNYANSLYSGWKKIATPDATGNDFVNWSSGIKGNTNLKPGQNPVDPLGAKLTQRIVWKVTGGKMNEPLSLQMASKICNEVATETAKAHLRIAGKLKTMGGPQAQETTVKILQELGPELVKLMSNTNQNLTLKMLSHQLQQSQYQISDAALNRGFVNYYRILKASGNTLGWDQTTFVYNSGVALTPMQKIELIPILDELILSVVMASEATQPPTPTPTPSPTPSPTPTPAPVPTTAPDQLPSDLGSNTIDSDQVRNVAKIIGLI